jgi:hypothetical protein
MPWAVTAATRSSADANAFLETVPTAACAPACSAAVACAACCWRELSVWSLVTASLTLVEK